MSISAISTAQDLQQYYCSVQDSEQLLGLYSARQTRQGHLGGVNNSSNARDPCAFLLASFVSRF